MGGQTNFALFKAGPTDFVWVQAWNNFKYYSGANGQASYSMMNIPNTNFYLTAIFTTSHALVLIDATQSAFCKGSLTTALPPTGLKFSALNVLDQAVGTFLCGQLIQIRLYTDPYTLLTTYTKLTTDIVDLIATKDTTSFLAYFSSAKVIKLISLSGSTLTDVKSITSPYPAQTISALLVIRSMLQGVMCTSSQCTAVKLVSPYATLWSLTLSGAANINCIQVIPKTSRFVVGTGATLDFYEVTNAGSLAPPSMIASLPIAEAALSVGVSDPGYYILVGTSTKGILISNTTCDPTCSTCIAAGNSGCTACISPLYLSNGYCLDPSPLPLNTTSTPPSSIPPPTDPTVFTCPYTLGILTGPVLDQCLNCIDYNIFLPNRFECSSTNIIYVDWTASMEILYDPKTQLATFAIITLELVDVDNNVPAFVRSNSDFTSGDQYDSRFSILFPRSFGQKLNSTTKTTFSFGLLDISGKNKLNAIVSSFDNPYKNTVFLSSNLRVILVSKDVQIETAVKSQISQLLDHKGEVMSNTVLSITRILLSASIPTFLALSALHINTGSGLIKLFQIIDIFGKFIYIPVEHSLILRSILWIVNQLSDFFDFNLYNTIGFDKLTTIVSTRYFGRLSTRLVSPIIVRNGSINYCLLILSFLSTFIEKLLIKIHDSSTSLGRKKALKSIVKYLQLIKEFMVEVCLVDVIFYGAYAVIHDDAKVGLGLGNILNYLSGVVIIMYYGFHIASEVSSICKYFQIRKQLKKDCASDNSVDSETKVVGKKHVKEFLKGLFEARVAILMITIVSSQTFPLLLHSAFVFAVLFCQIIHFYILFTKCPFSSIFEFVECCLVEVSLAFYTASLLTAHYFKPHPHLEFIAVIIFLLTIAAQAVISIKDLLVAFFKILKILCLVNKRAVPVRSSPVRVGQLGNKPLINVHSTSQVAELSKETARDTSRSSNNLVKIKGSSSPVKSEVDIKQKIQNWDFMNQTLARSRGSFKQIITNKSPLTNKYRRRLISSLAKASSSTTN